MKHWRDEIDGLDIDGIWALGNAWIRYGDQLHETEKKLRSTIHSMDWSGHAYMTMIISWSSMQRHYETAMDHAWKVGEAINQYADAIMKQAEEMAKSENEAFLGQILGFVVGIATLGVGSAFGAIASLAARLASTLVNVATRLGASLSLFTRTLIQFTQTIATSIGTRLGNSLTFNIGAGAGIGAAGTIAFDKAIGSAAAALAGTKPHTDWGSEAWNIGLGGALGGAFGGMGAWAGGPGKGAPKPPGTSVLKDALANLHDYNQRTGSSAGLNKGNPNFNFTNSPGKGTGGATGFTRPDDLGGGPSSTPGAAPGPKGGSQSAFDSTAPGAPGSVRNPGDVGMPAPGDEVTFNPGGTNGAIPTPTPPVPRAPTSPAPKPGDSGPPVVSRPPGAVRGPDGSVAPAKPGTGDSGPPVVSQPPGGVRGPDESVAPAAPEPGASQPPVVSRPPAEPAPDAPVVPAAPGGSESNSGALAPPPVRGGESVGEQGAPSSVVSQPPAAERGPGVPVAPAAPEPGVSGPPVVSQPPAATHGPDAPAAPGASDSGSGALAPPPVRGGESTGDQGAPPATTQPPAATHGPDAPAAPGGSETGNGSATPPPVVSKGSGGQETATGPDTHQQQGGDQLAPPPAAGKGTDEVTTTPGAGEQGVAGQEQGAAGQGPVSHQPGGPEQGTAGQGPLTHQPGGPEQPVQTGGSEHAGQAGGSERPAQTGDQSVTRPPASQHGDVTAPPQGSDPVRSGGTAPVNVTTSPGAGAPPVAKAPPGQVGTARPSGQHAPDAEVSNGAPSRPAAEENPSSGAEQGGQGQPPVARQEGDGALTQPPSARADGDGALTQPPSTRADGEGALTPPPSRDVSGESSVQQPGGSGPLNPARGQDDVPAPVRTGHDSAAVSAPPTAKSAADTPVQQPGGNGLSAGQRQPSSSASQDAPGQVAGKSVGPSRGESQNAGKQTENAVGRKNAPAAPDRDVTPDDTNAPAVREGESAVTRHDGEGSTSSGPVREGVSDLGERGTVAPGEGGATGGREVAPGELRPLRPEERQPLRPEEQQGGWGSDYAPVERGGREYSPAERQALMGPMGKGVPGPKGSGATGGREVAPGELRPLRPEERQPLRPEEQQGAAGSEKVEYGLIHDPLRGKSHPLRPEDRQDTSHPSDYSPVARDADQVEGGAVARGEDGAADTAAGARPDEGGTSSGPVREGVADPAQGTVAPREDGAAGAFDGLVKDAESVPLSGLDHTAAPNHQMSLGDRHRPAAENAEIERNNRSGAEDEAQESPEAGSGSSGPVAAAGEGRAPSAPSRDGDSGAASDELVGTSGQDTTSASGPVREGASEPVEGGAVAPGDKAVAPGERAVAPGDRAATTHAGERSEAGGTSSGPVREGVSESDSQALMGPMRKGRELYPEERQGAANSELVNVGHFGDGLARDSKSGPDTRSVRGGQEGRPRPEQPEELAEYAEERGMGSHEAWDWGWEIDQARRADDPVRVAHLKSSFGSRLDELGIERPDSYGPDPYGVSEADGARGNQDISGTGSAHDESEGALTGLSERAPERSGASEAPGTSTTSGTVGARDGRAGFAELFTARDPRADALAVDLPAGRWGNAVADAAYQRGMGLEEVAGWRAAAIKAHASGDLSTVRGFHNTWQQASGKEGYLPVAGRGAGDTRLTSDEWAEAWYSYGRERGLGHPEANHWSSLIHQAHERGNDIVVSNLEEGLVQRGHDFGASDMALDVRSPGRWGDEVVVEGFRKGMSPPEIAEWRNAADDVHAGTDQKAIGDFHDAWGEVTSARPPVRGGGLPITPKRWADAWGSYAREQGMSGREADDFGALIKTAHETGDRGVVRSLEGSLVERLGDIRTNNWSLDLPPSHWGDKIATEAFRQGMPPNEITHWRAEAEKAHGSGDLDKVSEFHDSWDAAQKQFAPSKGEPLPLKPKGWGDQIASEASHLGMTPKKIAEWRAAAEKAHASGDPVKVSEFHDLWDTTAKKHSPQLKGEALPVPPERWADTWSTYARDHGMSGEETAGWSQSLIKAHRAGDRPGVHDLETRWDARLHEIRSSDPNALPPRHWGEEVAQQAHEAGLTQHEIDDVRGQAVEAHSSGNGGRVREFHEAWDQRLQRLGEMGPEERGAEITAYGRDHGMTPPDASAWGAKYVSAIKAEDSPGVRALNDGFDQHLTEIETRGPARTRGLAETPQPESPAPGVNPDGAAGPVARMPSVLADWGSVHGMAPAEFALWRGQFDAVGHSADGKGYTTLLSAWNQRLDSLRPGVPVRDIPPLANEPRPPATFAGEDGGLGAGTRGNLGDGARGDLGDGARGDLGDGARGSEGSPAGGSGPLTIREFIDSQGESGPTGPGGASSGSGGPKPGAPGRGPGDEPTGGADGAGGGRSSESTPDGGEPAKSTPDGGQPSDSTPDGGAGTSRGVDVAVVTEERPKPVAETEESRPGGGRGTGGDEPTNEERAAERADAFAEHAVDNGALPAEAAQWRAEYEQAFLKGNMEQLHAVDARFGDFIADLRNGGRGAPGADTSTHAPPVVLDRSPDAVGQRQPVASTHDVDMVLDRGRAAGMSEAEVLDWAHKIRQAENDRAVNHLKNAFSEHLLNLRKPPATTSVAPEPGGDHVLHYMMDRGHSAGMSPREVQDWTNKLLGAEGMPAANKVTSDFAERLHEMRSTSATRPAPDPAAPTTDSHVLHFMLDRGREAGLSEAEALDWADKFRGAGNMAAANQVTRDFAERLHEIRSPGAMSPASAPAARSMDDRVLDFMEVRGREAGLSEAETASWADKFRGARGMPAADKVTRDFSEHLHNLRSPGAAPTAQALPDGSARSGDAALSDGFDRLYVTNMGRKAGMPEGEALRWGAEIQTAREAGGQRAVEAVKARFVDALHDLRVSPPTSAPAAPAPAPAGAPAASGSAKAPAPAAPVNTPAPAASDAATGETPVQGQNLTAVAARETAEARADAPAAPRNAPPTGQRPRPAPRWNLDFEHLSVTADPQRPAPPSHQPYVEEVPDESLSAPQPV
ncbi:hypothetical protein B1H18_20060, partial [Streptomyces tsukubensis]